ncbi:MAG: hypothetical protein V4662_02300 [Verrucomicrobiota bacterium]
MADYHGGHTTKSPDGKWTVSVWDGGVADAETLTLMVYEGEEPTALTDKAPALFFETVLPGFYARGSATKNTWSPDGRECHFQLDAYGGQASMVVIPSENRVEFDPLTAYGYQRTISPVPWFVLLGALLLLHHALVFWRQRRARKSPVSSEL